MLMVRIGNKRKPRKNLKTFQLFRNRVHKNKLRASKVLQPLHRYACEEGGSMVLDNNILVDIATQDTL